MLSEHQFRLCLCTEVLVRSRGTVLLACHEVPFSTLFGAHIAE